MRLAPNRLFTIKKEENVENNYAIVGYVNFLFALYCARWAQNTRHNPWGWFFFGLFLAPIAGLALVSKNNKKS